MHQDNRQPHNSIKKADDHAVKENKKLPENINSVPPRSVNTNRNVSKLDYKSIQRRESLTTKNQPPKIAKCNVPAFLICIVMVLFLATEKILSTISSDGNDLYIAVAIAQFLVFVLPCAFYSAIKNHNFNSGLSQYNFRPFSPKLLGFTFFSLLILLFGSMIIKYFGYMVFDVVNESTSVSAKDSILALSFATIVVPAITEEILFRGVIFTEYEKRNVGALGAIIISSLLFAFIHFDIKNFVTYFYAGIVLAIILHITRSLFIPIIVHLLNNSICLFTDTFLRRVSKESISSVFVMFILIVLFLVALFFWLENIEWICAGKSARVTSEKYDSDVTQPSRLIPQNQSLKNIFSALFLAPAFIAAAVIYLFAVFVIK